MFWKSEKMLTILHKTIVENIIIKGEEEVQIIIQSNLSINSRSI